MIAKIPYVCIYGATGSGKSAYALSLAKSERGEIINADSVQFYRGFAIGAAKPSPEEQAAIPHHLLDILHSHEEFTAADFARRARQLIGGIWQRGKLPIVVGGSGLYLRCLWGEKFHDLPADASLQQQLRQRESTELYRELQTRDPQRAAELHIHDRVRVMRSLEVCLLSGTNYSELTRIAEDEDFPPQQRIFLNPPRQLLLERLGKRTSKMLAAGLIEEVEGLLAASCSPQAKPMQSIGYKQVLMFLNGEISSRAELEEKIYIATRQYAKRQVTWFKNLKHDVVVVPSDQD